ncbi:hypothetical protein [Pseudanabaena sp. FACHB-2040]|uniref:slr1601 family putative cell division protein n=1 Tax=Pseudanabaena sp. FACHB-2040 TaxID=2692859 RepID=UPI0016874AEA|nr:hypothetical protein [Pseudanabaena sp. FACHB-2040]MBD2259878.1 hypothetical protein [Pseudanabaena sp. FACHB-2040]
MYTPYSPPETARPRRRPVRVRRQIPRRRPRPPQTEKGLLLELSAKLLVNGVLACAAVTSLVRIAPYTQAQRQELHKVQTAVAVAEAEASQLRSDFSRYFDPRQAGNVMREQSGWESPNQRQIVWIDPTGSSH